MKTNIPSTIYMLLLPLMINIESQGMAQFIQEILFSVVPKKIQSQNSFSPNQPEQHSPEVIEDSAPTLFIDNNVVVNGHTPITIVTKDDGPNNIASDRNISNNNSLSSIGSPGQGSDMEKEDRGTTATTISTLLPVGMHVCLHSLKAEKHNGAEGEIVEYDDVKGRYKVQISGKKKA